MSENIIKATNVSKRYRLGSQQKRSDTFARQMLNLVKSPIDNFRRLTSLSRFHQDDSSVFWALKDVDFAVQPGEVLGVIGHNGAGKSTLLKILSRITEPSMGEVQLSGRVSSLLEVGTGFHPELSGRENVYMNGTILGMRKKEIDLKFDEIIAFSGVEKHIDTAVKFYSSGMKVRLGFAVAAHLEPEILIIDEVLAVGDMEFQKKCLGKMEDVSGSGRTVLFVSHNMESVNHLCTRSLLLNNGSISYDGDTKEAIKKYLGVNKIDGYLTLTRQIKKDKPFYISKVSIVDQSGIVKANPLSNDETLFLELEILSDRDLAQVHLAYEIVNTLNVRIVYSDYTDSHRLVASLNKGKNCVRVELFTRSLLSGEYYIHFQLGDLITFENDHSKSIISFVIQGHPLMKTHYRGLIQEIYEWEIYRNENVPI